MVSSHIPKHTFGSRWTLLQRWLHAFQISPWFRAVIALYGSYQSILDINNCFHIDYHRAETCKHQLSQVRAWKTKGRGAKMCTARPSWMSISQQSLGYKDNMYKVAVCLFFSCIFYFFCICLFGWMARTICTRWWWWWWCWSASRVLGTRTICTR